MESTIRLVIQDPHGANRSIIPQAVDLTIGQAAANDIVLADLKASRVHARLTWADARWTLLDLDSAGGTWVNGQRSQGPVTLLPGDVIRVGDSTLRLEAVTPATEPPSPPRPPVETAAPPRGNRWLTGLLKVASVFAPLVGQEAAPVDKPPRELRGQLAAAMGAFGILLAALQLLIGAYDLISRPAALLSRALPYIAAVLLIGGAILAARVALRSTSRQRRLRASALLAALLVIGLGWASYTAYQWLRPPASFLVLIADFDGSNATRKGDFAQRIGAELVNQLSTVGDLVTVERTLETYPDAAAAQAAGRRRKAGMVIWGSYSDLGVTPQIELLRQPLPQESAALPDLVLNAVGAAPVEAASPSRLGDLSHLTRAPLPTSDLNLFAAHGPEQMTYVVAALLATGLYADGQYENALALFDTALASAQASGSAIRGLERVYFQRAVTLHALGRATEATTDLEKAIQLDPAFMQAHYNLAISYAGSCAVPHSLTRAVAEAETAARLVPDDARAHRLLGSLYQQAGRQQDALAALLKALNCDSQDALTYQLLAATYNTLGKTSEAGQAGQQAIALLQAALADKPADPYMLQLALGDAFVGAAQYDQAIGAYQAAAQLSPNAAAPHRGLGNAYYWQGQPDQALAEYRQASALAPQDPAAPLLAGLILAEQGDLAGAITAQETAARLSQCDPAPHLLLGGLYFQQDDYVKGAESYQAALAVDATNADAWYVLGSLRYQLDDPEAAAQAAHEAVNRDPNLADAQWLLARVRLDLGDAASALPAAQAYARLAPDDPSAHGLLGDIHLDLERWQEAAEAYEASLALADDADTHLLAGLARQQTGQIDAAIAHFQAALALDPASGNAWQSLGGAYRQQGRLAEAAEAYKQAVAIADNAFARDQLAAIYLQNGNAAGALAEYQRAAALDPAEPRYQVALGNLYANQGELSRAEAAFRAALALDDGSAEAHAGLAGAAYRQCSINTAVQSMAAAANLAPAYRGRLAALYEAQGRTADAGAAYAELAAAPPTDWLAHLTSADYLFRGGKPDEAARVYQQILEANSAPVGYVTSLIHAALGQIDYAQERLFAAGSAFEQALAAYPSNADAEAALGDLALRAGDAAEALAHYDAALRHIPSYLAGLPAENAVLQAVTLNVRRGLALARQGDATAAAAALDQALAAAQAAVDLTPRSPLAQFALGTAYLGRGQTEEAGAAFARASECDQSLSAALSRLEEGLAKLKQSP